MSSCIHSLSSRLHSARVERRLTHDALAQKMHVDASLIRDFEDGGLVNIDRLRSLCKALDCSSDYLLGLTDNLERNE